MAVIRVPGRARAEIGTVIDIDCLRAVTGEAYIEVVGNCDAVVGGVGEPQNGIEAAHLIGSTAQHKVIEVKSQTIGQLLVKIRERVRTGATDGSHLERIRNSECALRYVIVVVLKHL